MDLKLHAIWSDEDYTFCGIDFRDSVDEDTELTIEDVSCTKCIGYLKNVGIV